MGQKLYEFWADLKVLILDPMQTVYASNIKDFYG